MGFILLMIQGSAHHDINDFIQSHGDIIASWSNTGDTQTEIEQDPFSS